MGGGGGGFGTFSDEPRNDIKNHVSTFQLLIPETKLGILGQANKRLYFEVGWPSSYRTEPELRPSNCVLPTRIFFRCCVLLLRTFLRTLVLENRPEYPSVIGTVPSSPLPPAPCPPPASAGSFTQGIRHARGEELHSCLLQGILRAN